MDINDIRAVLTLLGFPELLRHRCLGVQQPGPQGFRGSRGAAVRRRNAGPALREAIDE